MNAHTRSRSLAAPKASASPRTTVRRYAAWRGQPRLSRLLWWLLSSALGSLGLVHVTAHAQVASSALPSGGRVMVGNGQLQFSNNLLVVI